jgi:mono/diheme cytochrome c family protein
MIKPLLCASTVVLFAIAAVSFAGPMAQESTPAAAPGVKNSVKSTPQSRAHAKEIYDVDCALCHGTNGDGKTDLAKAMGLTLGDWTDAKTLAARPDAELFKTIRNGKGKMPSEAEGRAKDHDVWSLVVYIRSLASREGSAAAPATAN